MEKKSPNELKALQEYIKKLCQEKGWNKNSSTEIFLLLTEEIGELAKAIRNLEKLHTQSTENQPSTMQEKKELAYELVDVFNYVLDIANYYDVDLEKAFWEKNKENETRTWN